MKKMIPMALAFAIGVLKVRLVAGLAGLVPAYLP